MSNFQVLNDEGYIVVDDEVKLVGTVYTYPIIEIPPDPGAARMMVSLRSCAPSWFPGTQTSVLMLDPFDSGEPPLTLIKPNEGGFGAGRETFNAGAGTLYFLRDTYTVESGYLDIFDASGTLIWSAESASKVPRVIGTHHFTLSQLQAGVEIYIGDALFMLNNIVGKIDVNPGPTGTSARAYGIFWGFSNGILKLQFNDSNNSSQPLGPKDLLAITGWTIYLYKFAG